MLEVKELFDQAGNYRNRFVIRNKQYDVDEVVMDLYHIISEGLEKLEEATYALPADDLPDLVEELVGSTEPTLN